VAEAGQQERFERGEPDNAVGGEERDVAATDPERCPQYGCHGQRTDDT
jgi:hypothetical protein